MPSYPEIRLALPEPVADRPPDRGGGAGPHPYRHRRADRLADAPLLPASQPALHHQLPHSLSRIRVGEVRRTRTADLCVVAQFSFAFGRRDGPHADHRRRSDPARLRAGQALDPRRQPQPFPPQDRARARPAAADLSLGWPGGGGKEPRSAAQPRPARLDGDRRRRAGAPQPRAPLSSRAFSRRHARRSARRRLRQRRRVRLPVAHRHFRDRPDRGDGERTAGRGLSGARADRRRRPRRRRAGRGLAGGLPQGADHPKGKGARTFPAFHLEGERAAVPRQHRDEPVGTPATAPPPERVGVARAAGRLSGSR